MVDDSAVIRVIAPITFRAADKFFKFVSWALIVTVLKLGEKTTGSSALLHFSALATAVMSIALITQIYYIAARSPDDFKIPPKYHTAARVVQVLFALILLGIVASPYLLLDTIIDDLVKARLPN